MPPDTIVDHKAWPSRSSSLRRISNHLVILLQHIRLHRITVLDGFIQSAHTRIPERHMKRTGGIGVADSVRTSTFFQIFDRLFVLHTEALFFVVTKSPRSFKSDVL